MIQITLLLQPKEHEAERKSKERILKPTLFFPDGTSICLEVHRINNTQWQFSFLFHEAEACLERATESPGMLGPIPMGSHGLLLGFRGIARVA